MEKMDSNTLINAMDPSITLWQFLLHLLDDASQRHLITWTGEDGEFKLLDAEENIIKKVSGQKFVYKFVGQPDNLLLEVLRGGEERRDNLDSNSQTKSPGGGATSCPSKGLMQRSSPSNTQKSCRNDYMKSGLYSTFTIQSLQTAPPARPIKAELLLSQEPSAKAARIQREVGVMSESSQPLGAAGVEGLQVIVSQSSPCTTPAPSPQLIASSTTQHQAAMVTGPPTVAPPPVIKEEILPSEEELLKMVSLEEKEEEEVMCATEDGDPPLAIIETPPTPSPSLDPPTESAVVLPAGVRTGLSEVVPPRPKKPRGLELPSSPSLLYPGLSLDKVNAAVNSLLAPGCGSNTLTPSVITSHALFPTNGSNQIHIPALSVDGLSTPVVLSPGPQKP
ncbi:hypothetical protein CRUP_010844 [Coryphaenoides rupestris]|nr:hypothetical protein CRUP_010844 [Coryphaenoides rupestris]